MAGSGVIFALTPIMIDKDRVIEQLRQENQELHETVHLLNSRLGAVAENSALTEACQPQAYGPAPPGTEEGAWRGRAREHKHRRKVQQLARVCSELQQIQGDDPFWLSCRHAGAILGVSHTQTARYIHELVVAGMLEVVEAHSSNRATRYRYIHRR